MSIQIYIHRQIPEKEVTTINISQIEINKNKERDFHENKDLSGLGSCDRLKNSCSIFGLAYGIIEAYFKQSWFILEAYVHITNP